MQHRQSSAPYLSEPDNNWTNIGDFCMKNGEVPQNKAALAQLVEHIIRNDGVGCSNHPSGTISAIRCLLIFR